MVFKIRLGSWKRSSKKKLGMKPYSLKN